MLLAGNEKMMRQYLSCSEGCWNGRSDGEGSWGRKREMHEWHPVIHGKMSEAAAVELRRDIVNAHRDLLVNERILDLEDQVKALVAQLNKLNAEKEGLYQRLREAA